MGLLSTVEQNVNIKNDRAVLIKPTRNGGIMVCPACNGTGKETFPDYGTYHDCRKCDGGGAIEIKVVRNNKK